MELTGKYKGYSISISNFNERFEAKIDNSIISSNTLSGLMNRIDQIEKKDFERVNVLARDGWSGSKFVEGVVTSHADEGSVWFKSNKDGRRSKLTVQYVIIDNEENRLKIDEIKKLNAEAEDLRQRIRSVGDSLVRYEIKN